METSRVLQRVREAAQDVREAANSCKVIGLKDEGHSIAQKAQEVLSKIEERTRSATGQHVAQAVENAAHLAYQALAQAQGRLVTASREYKGGFLSKVKATLDTSHKKSFREAHEKLHAALLSLDSSLDLGSIEQDAAAAAGGSGPTQAQVQQAGPDGELYMRCDRGNTVHSLGLINTGVPGSKPNLWVGLKWSTDFYPGCSSARKESESVVRGKAVTCIFCRPDTRSVWTGHADGSVMLHKDGKWGAAQYKTQVGLPIRALATDPRLNCWAGDDAGILYMLHPDRSSAQIVLRKVDVPLASAHVWQQSAARSGYTASSASSTTAAPIAALLGRGDAMVSAGGHDRNYVTLWNSQKCEMVEHCATQTFGAAHALAAVDWQEVVPANAAAAAGSYMAQPVPASDLAGWRLLSGHESGQVLLWQVLGLNTRPGGRSIQLLCVIMEPRQIGSIRHIGCFEDFSMMLLVDAGGWLTVTEAPTPGELARLAGSAPPNMIPGAPGPSRWSPKVARIKAHKSPIIAAASAEELLVTASSTTVKSWTADQLKLEAQGDGLMFSRSSRTLSASSSSAPSGPAAGAGSASRSAGAQLLQERLSGNSGPSGTDTDLSHENMASGDSGAGVPASAAAGPGSGAAQQQQQQLGRIVSSTPAVLAAGGAAAAAAAAAAGGAAAAGRLPAAGRIPASAAKPNPFSRSAVEARLTGMVVGPNNRVVPAALSKLDPNQAFGVLQQVAPVLNMLQTPQWQHPGLLPLQPYGASMSQGPGQLTSPASAAGQGGQQADRLEQSNSVKPSDAIKADHIITCGELELNVAIGVGAEGKVYRGKWCSVDIAAKEYLAVEDGETELHTSGQEVTEAARQKAQNALLKEVGILAKLTHPNLVRFCGVCLDPPLVVMEYYRNGSMFKMLECARAAVQQGRTNKYVNYLSWKRRLQMLHDVASGMLYLHSRRYVHGDLRSPNLFVTENGRVKIGDFGFTKRLKRSKETVKVARITHPRWVAPELLGAYELSTASDVYSFGIIMYEVLTLNIPFAECKGKETVAIRVLAQGLRPLIPPYEELPPNTSRICLDNYIRLMKECWAQDPKQRPSFGPIARRLKAMQHWLHACTNALHLTSTANRLQSLRQDSSTRGAPVPLAVGGSLPAAVPPHVDAPATQVAMDARGLVGAPDAADAAAGGAAAAATAPLVAAAQPRQERQQPDHAALSSGTDEVPPPVPDPAVAAAAEASAPKPVAEPSVQVSVVDGKPIVCIDMGRGKPEDLQAVEEKLLAEMQTLTLDRGEAVAKQAQFIIMESDLPAPQRTLSTVSEGTLPADRQQSGNDGAAAAAATPGGGSAFATAQLLAGGQAGSSREVPSEPGPAGHGQPPATRDLSSAATAAGAATVGAGAAVGALGQLPSAPAPIKLSPAGPLEGSSAGNIDAFVRDASQADTHDKVQVWLQTGTGSTELPPAEQQQQQLLLHHEQRLQAAAAPSEQQERAATATGAAQASGQQQQEQEQLDVFTAADSPFFTLMPPRFSSGSVELGPFKLAAGSNQQPSLQQGVSSVATGGFGTSLPSFMDPNALDDSTLPAAEGSGGGLSVAHTIVYPEDFSPVEALARSAASIRSGSINSNSTLTLWNMAGPSAAAGGGGAAASGSRSLSSGGSQLQPRGGGGRLPDSNPYSFTATERSPFACLEVPQDDDAPLPAAADAAAVSSAARQGGANAALTQVDSNVVSCGPFGKQAGGTQQQDNGQGLLPRVGEDSVVREPGPFGGCMMHPGLAPGDSVVREPGPFGNMLNQGLGPAGGDSVVREPGPFGNMQPGLGAPGVNEDSIAPPLPLSPRQGAGGGEAGAGLWGLGDNAAAAAGGLRRSPPPSPRPPGSSTSGVSPVTSGGAPPLQPGQFPQGGQLPGYVQYPPASPMGHAGGAAFFGRGTMGPVSRVGSSPRHASPAPAGAVVHSAVDAHGRRWSNSSKASSVTGSAAAAAGGYGLPQQLQQQQHDGGGDAGAGAAAGGGGAGILHKPLDDSVLNKNLRVALGGQPTSDGDIDVVDAQQKLFEDFQRTSNAGGLRRSSGGSAAAQQLAPGSPPVGGGFMQQGVKGWVPGLLPPEAVLQQQQQHMGPPPPVMQMHHDGAPGGPGCGPMPMPGWGGDGIVPYGAGVAARGRASSGVDSTGGMSAWTGGTGASPPVSHNPGAYPNVGGGVQAAAYMQMQAAAAAGVAAQGGNWGPQVQGPGPYSMQPGGMVQPGGMMQPGGTMQQAGPQGVMSSSPGMGGYLQQGQRQQMMWQQQQQQPPQQQQQYQQQYQYQQQQQQQQQQQYQQQQYQQQQYQQQQMYKQYQQRGPM